MTNFRYFLLLPTLFYLLSPPYLYADEKNKFIIEDSPELIEDDSLFDYFEKTVSLQLAGSYAGFIEEDNERSNLNFKVRYADSWKNLSFVLEGRAYDSEATYTFTRTYDDIETCSYFTNEDGTPVLDDNGNRIPDRCEEITESFSSTFESAETELREGYLRYQTDLMDIYVGRRVLVLGQFNLFSPVDLFLPIDFSSTSLSFSKVENRLPQDMLSLSLYSPTDTSIELQLHFLPEITRDALTTDAIEQGQEYFSPVLDELTVEPYQEPENESQYVARLLLTEDNFTIGLTYFKGFDFFTQSLAVLTTPPEASSASSALNIENLRAGNFYGLPHPTYPEKTGYGIEISVPQGNVQYRIEATYSNIYRDINFWGIPRVSTGSATDGNVQRFIDLINDNTQDFDLEPGEYPLYLETDQIIVAFGFDYQTSKWLVNFAVLVLQDLYTDEQQTLYELAHEIQGASSSSDLGKLNILPIGHVARSFERPNGTSHTIGLAAGFVGLGQGISTYYRYRYSGNLSIGASLDYLQYLNDSAITDSESQRFENMFREENDNSSVTEGDSIFPSIRLGFIYQL